jgi:hypothetical protein
MKATAGFWSSIVGHESPCGRVARIALAILREIFDECAWERFVARNADHNGSFRDFLAERHGRPRQRCC